jgi:hypothetical protein
MPANNLKGVDRLAQGQSDKASVATVGAGSPSHVSAVYFANATGARLNLVPYRGGGPAMQDLVGNQVDLMIAGRRKRSRRRSPGGSRPSRSPQRPGFWRARHPDRRRGGHAGHVYLVLAWAVDTARRAEGRPREGERCGGLRLPATTVRKRLAGIHQEISPREQQTPDGLAAYQKAEIDKWCRSSRPQASRRRRQRRRTTLWSPLLRLVLLCAMLRMMASGLSVERLNELQGASCRDDRTVGRDL